MAGDTDREENRGDARSVSGSCALSQILAAGVNHPAAEDEKSIAHIRQLAAGVTRRLQRNSEKIRRDTEAARLGGNVVAGKNKPPIHAYRFRDDRG